MKTNVNFIESANLVVKTVAAELRNANSEYNSLSSVLRVMLRKDMQQAGYAVVLRAVGVQDIKALTPAYIKSVCEEEQFVENKKGERVLAIQGYKKLEDGSKEIVWRKITSWTPRKVVLLLAQAQQIKAVKQAEAEAKAERERKAAERKARKATAAAA